jgi:Glycosyl hydrolase family 59
VGQNGSLFASADIRYVLDWLACAKQHGLTISYLGGRNKRDNGSHGAWFHSLRAALDNAGYANVKIISGAASAPTSGSTSPARTLPSSGRTTTVATRPASFDGQPLDSLTDSALTRGTPGITTGR